MKRIVKFLHQNLKIVVILLIITTSVLFFFFNRRNDATNICIDRQVYLVCFSKQYAKKYAITGEGVPLLEDIQFDNIEELNLHLYDGYANESIYIRELFKSDMTVDIPHENYDKWVSLASLVIPKTYTYESTEDITISDTRFHIVKYLRCESSECKQAGRYDSVYITEVSDRYILFFKKNAWKDFNYFEKEVLSTFQLKRR